MPSSPGKPSQGDATLQTQGVNQVYSIIACERVEIDSARLFDRIPAEPPARAGLIPAVSVVDQVSFLVLVFGREPEGIVSCHGSCGSEQFTEGAVIVVGGDTAVGGIDQRPYVAIAIVGIKAGGGDAAMVGQHGQQPAHSASSLQRPAQVRPPQIGPDQAVGFVEFGE